MVNESDATAQGAGAPEDGGAPRETVADLPRRLRRKRVRYPTVLHPKASRALAVVATIAAVLIWWFIVSHWEAVWNASPSGPGTVRGHRIIFMSALWAAGLAVYFWALSFTSRKAWAEKVAREADDPHAPSKREWWTI